jgi:hypothetical protein
MRILRGRIVSVLLVGTRVRMRTTREWPEPVNRIACDASRVIYAWRARFRWSPVAHSAWNRENSNF